MKLTGLAATSAHRPAKALVGVAIVVLFSLSFSNARANAWAGALEGFGRAIAEQAQQQQEFDRQKQLLEYQHKLELERLERNALRERQRLDRQAQIDREQRAEHERRQEAVRQQQRVAEDKRLQEEADKKRNATTTGTGFFVAPGGYLITNHHVVDEATDFAIRDYKGRYFKATVISKDASRDLALLKVDAAFPALQIAHSDAVSKGQRVIAVGYPQVSIQGNESKVTDGLISSLSGIRNDENWFQISVPIQGGNSGGPLVTENGSVVGVVVATANASRYFKNTGNLPQSINYAIKSKILLDFLKAQNIQIPFATKGKVGVDAIDASTVMIIAKNSPLDLVYTPSPEQLAREARGKSMAAADERRTEKQRSDEIAFASKRDLAVSKAYPDWNETKGSDIFVAWLAEQKIDIATKLDSPRASDVIAVIKQYQAELPKFVNRYVATVTRPKSPIPAPVVAVAPPPSPMPQIPVVVEPPLVQAQTFEQSSLAHERKDYRTAFAGFAKLAEQGHAAAQNNLGVMYKDGQGVSKDNEQASVWYRKAAEQGNASAQFNLGLMYLGGQGVPKDEPLAVAWYRKAAEQEHANAQYNLGLMYAQGRGIPKDEQSAYFWWLLASAQGTQAVENRDIVGRTLSPEQRAAARAAALNWKPKAISYPSIVTR
ncbi:trypsin-like peptidase domain-containing protein [Polaromonas sp.]|uniref:trypsin-like peptidase domain-containing protein n=1 Tax=Polaromonas sp. TaxID=1869339 RepID=UPI0035668140